MINKNHAVKLIALLATTVFLGLIMFSGCTDEKEVVRTEVVVEKDTVLINIISVDSIYASMDSVTQGLPITLTVQITKGPEAGTVTINWHATGGHFDSETGDTVTWTAPDNPGVYTIAAHADDGQYIGIGTRMVGVGMYAPTATPYYLGDAACSNCHSGVHGDWEMTGHAHAWETLQNSGHPQSFCNPCHAVGWAYNPTDSSQVANAGDGGYDEAPILNYVNVQCEACHGAGSDHVQSQSAADIQVEWDAMTCGKCHDGTHHPFLTEWISSPHNFDPYTSSHGAPVNTFCEGCHEGVAAGYRLGGDLSGFYGGGSVAARPDTTDVPVEPINCVTCHNAHSDENPGQVRTTDNVQLVTANNESPIITEGGVGKLCMQCHHARRGPESQIQNGYAHFGPHANPQADMLKAKSAYHGVAGPNFPWVGPSHLLVENSCKTCHLATREFGGGPGGAAVVGHEFIPKPEACVGCHGPINDFDDIMALEDFDGDGTVEGIQSEVQGLMHLLEAALVADGLDTTGVGFAGALGDTLLSTYQQREAGYNLIFLEDDKSKGIHNPDYAIQLLQQSILYIGGTLPSPAQVVKNDNEVVGAW